MKFCTQNVDKMMFTCCARKCVGSDMWMLAKTVLCSTYTYISFETIITGDLFIYLRKYDENKGMDWIGMRQSHAHQITRYTWKQSTKILFEWFQGLFVLLASLHRFTSLSFRHPPPPPIFLLTFCFLHIFFISFRCFVFSHLLLRAFSDWKFYCRER